MNRLSSLLRSLVTRTIIAISIFCEHNTLGSNPAVAPAPRKNATAKQERILPPAASIMLVRSTSFSHNEAQSDSDSAAFASKTGVRLRYWTPDRIGTASVKFSRIPPGSLIIVRDSGAVLRAYLAANKQGSAPCRSMMA